VVPLTLGVASRDLSMGWVGRTGSVPPAYSRSSAVAVFLRACTHNTVRIKLPPVGYFVTKLR